MSKVKVKINSNIGMSTIFSPACHFDERSEEKSLFHVIPNEVRNLRFLAALEMTERLPRNDNILRRVGMKAIRRQGKISGNSPK